MKIVFNTHTHTTVLTASHLNGADLLVEWIILEIHRTGEHQGDANRVEHLTARIDAQQDVGHDNLVKVALLLVLEEQIGPPNSIGIGEHQVTNVRVVLRDVVIELEPIVHPLLAEGDLHRIFLPW